MSGTNQNPYPVCIKCGVDLSPQDSRGWEKIETHQTDGGKGPEIWLCPNCIMKMTAVQDIKNYNTVMNEEIIPLRKEVQEYKKTFKLLSEALEKSKDI